MALSDSASRSILKKTSKLNVYGAVVYIANYIRNTLLSRNQTFQKNFSSCIPLLSQLRKSVGPCSALYKYNWDVVIKLYCI